MKSADMLDAGRDRWHSKAPPMTTPPRRDTVRASERRRDRAGLAAAVAVLAAAVLDASMALWATGLDALAPTEALGALALALLLAAPLAALAGLALGALEPALTHVARRLRWRGLLLLGASLGVAAAAVLALREREVDWDTIDLRLGLLPLVAAVAGLVAWRFAMRRARHLVVATLVLAGLVAGLALARDHGAGPGVERLRTDTWLAAPVLARTAGLLDGDGDGHPAWLCGDACDCDDDDADRHPGRTELADDGIDQDCDGDDLSGREQDDFAELFAARPPVATVEPAPTTAAERPDILVLTVDTLRADHLGVYGYARATSPRIDAWAREAVVFEQARSTGPSTRFSIPPLMIGKYFTELARSRGEWPTISDKETTLAERLHGLGYVSAAFHSIRYLWPQYGLDQGFDHYSVDCITQRWPPLRMSCSDFITDEALAWLDVHGTDQGVPLLLWAYYGDPHAQYVRHEGYPSFGPEYVDAYDDEIAFVDHHIGRLLDGLAQRRRRPTVIVLVSDHGEGLDAAQDHGSRYHSANLFDELVRVPLIVSGPGFPAHRVQTPVSLVDLVPTVLDLLAQPGDPALRGVSLMPWLRDEAGNNHPPVLFEKHRALDEPQHGMVAWPYKVIQPAPGGRARIFDLSADPGERRDLAGTMDTAERRRLVGALRHWHEQVRRPFDDTLRH